MRRAGCWQVSLGVESGDPAVLAATCKGVTLDEVRSAVAALRGAGVESRGFFMLGLPGDTEGSMERTVSFALELGLDVAQFYVAVPYPGSEMASAAGLGPGSVPYEELLPNMPRRVRFRLSEVEGEGVRRAQIGAYLRFYLRPSYLAGRLPGVAARLARS
jgi:radical SAM superfamily enzyme YgiQ (UPF0313 family)